MEETLHQEYARVGDRHWWFRGRRAIFAAIFDTIAAGEADRRRRLLDVGCGTGDVLSVLKAYGEVHAIDVSEVAVQYCRERYGPTVDVRLGRVPEDVPQDASFDVVTAFDVIEHLDDDVLGLTALRGALKPGGWLVCTVPAFDFLWTGHDVANHHRRRYRAPLLRERVASAGFTVDRVTYFNTLLFPAAVAVRRLRPQQHHMRVPPAWLNAALARVFASERHWVNRRSLPFGLSLLVVARA
jgi:SAM-dependent methyltransferase